MGDGDPVADAGHSSRRRERTNSMTTAAVHPANGISGTVTGDVATGAMAPAGAAVDTLFGKLVSLYKSNDFLLSELATVRLKLSRARDYLGSPGCNPALAEAHLLRLRARQSAALAMLRANRLQVRDLLARLEGPPRTAS
jgi:hypothetical protein